MRQIVKCKHSQGHVEMIISFMIFIGFIIALLYFLNPTETRQIDYTLLTITEEALMKEIMINYSSVSVTIDSSKIGDVDNADCFKVLNNLGLEGNLIIKDELGNVVDGSINGGINGEINIAHPRNGNRYYKIYASNEFNPTSYSCSTSPPSQPLSIGEYKYGALSNFDVVLEENIYGLVNEYNNDYNGLKEKLGLTNDFMIFVYDQDLNVLANATIFVPSVVEIVARNIPIVALNKTADPVELIINIRTW